jgi:hypothetical protein
MRLVSEDANKPWRALKYWAIWLGFAVPASWLMRSEMLLLIFSAILVFAAVFMQLYADYFIAPDSRLDRRHFRFRLAVVYGIAASLLLGWDGLRVVYFNIWKALIAGLCVFVSAYFCCSILSLVLSPVLNCMRSFASPGHCLHCGYDLMGNLSGKCPECGSSVPLYLRNAGSNRDPARRDASERKADTE